MDKQPEVVRMKREFCLCVYMAILLCTSNQLMARVNEDLCLGYFSDERKSEHVENVLFNLARKYKKLTLVRNSVYLHIYEMPTIVLAHMPRAGNSEEKEIAVIIFHRSKNIKYLDDIVSDFENKVTDIFPEGLRECEEFPGFYVPKLFNAAL